MPLPPNTNAVAPGEHKCDVCQEKDAKYYNFTWYIHICSKECFDLFIERYNKEIDDFAIMKLDPDSKDDLDAM